MNKGYVVHKNAERGEMELDWLKSKFSFSFANWHEPSRMGFGMIRVINDDIIAKKSGFGFHPHHDMEIVTIVFEGELTHEDSMGNKGIIASGDVQRMSAGTGVLHSEYNYGEKEVKLFQIWIMPKLLGVRPSYEQKKFDEESRLNSFQVIVSPTGVENSVKINQDAYFSLCDLSEKKEVTYEKKLDKNCMYIMIIDGFVEILGEKLERRDAIGINDENSVKIKAFRDSKLLVIEVPK